MRKFASNRRDIPAFQGCDESCTAEGGYPALCEMYPETHHEGCPRQHNAAPSLPPAPPTLSEAKRATESFSDVTLIAEGARRFAAANDRPKGGQSAQQFPDTVLLGMLASRLAALRAEVARLTHERDEAVRLANAETRNANYLSGELRAARSSAAGEDRSNGGSSG